MISTPISNSFVVSIDKDLAFFKREHSPRETQVTTDVWGPCWTLALTCPAPGEVAIRRAGGQQEIVGPVAIWIPPFSLVEWVVSPCTIWWYAYLSSAKVPTDLPQRAMIFPWSTDVLPKNSEEIFQLVRTSQDRLLIEKEEQVSAVGSRTKSYLDKHFTEDVSVKEMAADLGYSHSVMSRYFKKQFGMAPVAYRKKMRLFEAMNQMIIHGRTARSTSLELGFQDFSVFFKHFCAQFRARPSQYLVTSRHIREQARSEKAPRSSEA